MVLVSAVILESESHGARDHILLSQIRDSSNLEGQVPQEQGGPIIPPGTRFHFRRLLRLTGLLRWRYSIPPARWILSTSVDLSVRSVKLLLVFASTVIPSFSLKFHNEDFYSLLHMYVFRNGASFSAKEGVGLST
jgi:hypothetical protein